MSADPVTPAAASPGALGNEPQGSVSSASAAGLPGAGLLIVGYGNPLRSDDGVGQVVAARLARDPRFAGADIRAEHQLTPELALDASQAWLLVLVDAAEGVAAGEVALRELGPAGWAGAEDGQVDGLAGRDEEGGPPLTHHVAPEALLGLAAELWGAAPRAITVGLGPASLELGEDLSPEVEAAVPRAIDALADAVDALRQARRADRAREG